MHRRWRTREYERTCDDCGHTWRVPKWAAHPRRQGLPVSGGDKGGVPPPVAAAIGEAVVAAIDQLAERRATAFQRCPECGSEHYSRHGGSALQAKDHGQPSLDGVPSIVIVGRSCPLRAPSDTV
jgi:hypothetical protein